MEKKIIASPNAPRAAGPYSQAVLCGDTLYASGQLGVDVTTGKLADGLEAQAHCALKNLGAILAEAGMTYENVVKTTCLLADVNDFAAFNAVYTQYFKGDYPARCCYQAGAIPTGSLVEVELVAVK